MSGPKRGVNTGKCYGSLVHCWSGQLDRANSQEPPRWPDPISFSGIAISTFASPFRPIFRKKSERRNGENLLARDASVSRQQRLRYWRLPTMPRSRTFPPALRVTDRKSVLSGKSVVVRVDLGGRRIPTKKKDTL